MSAETRLDDSPDSKLLATADTAGIIRIWDAQTGQKRVMLRGHPGAIYALSFRPDSQYLAAAGVEDVTLWNLGPDPER